MSLRNTFRALPTLLKIGFADAVAYRAELFVWVLSTSMPLIMLALWTAVARDAPIGRFGEKEFVAYFLATFIVRQLTSSWASWEMNWEVRQGTLSRRLLRPIDPIASYAVENIAAIPLRLVIAIPVAVIGLVAVGAGQLPKEPAMWALWAASMLGGWLLTFLVNITIGALSLYMESSIKVMDVWLALFFVFSGYTIPIELFPSALRAVTDFLPFRYQIGLPVEILTSAHPLAEALRMLGVQWCFVAGLAVVANLVWRGGIRRYGAFGG